MLSFIWSLLLSIACCLVNLSPTEISEFELCTVHFMYISSNIEQILADEGKHKHWIIVWQTVLERSDFPRLPV